MPRKITDKDRLLSYAFTASVEELQEAVSIFTAALKAKSGSKPRGARTPARRPATPSTINKTDGQEN